MNGVVVVGVERMNDSLSENERMILEIVRRRPNIMRSAVAPKTNLTQPSVHRIIDALLEARFLTLGDPVIHGRGKPSPSLKLNAEARYSLGVSVNTDSLTFGLCDFSGRIVHEEMLDTPPTRRRDTLFLLKERLRAVMAARGVSKEKTVGIGFSMAGFFVGPDRCFNSPELLRDWSLVDLRRELETLFDLPVWTENNGTTGAIGESAVGAGRTYTTFGYLSFNYGFGGGIVLDGKPFFGAFGNAGELSRVYTMKESPSRPALGELLKRLEKGGIQIANIRDLRQRFDPSWPQVAEWVEEITPALNRTIDMLRAVIDPAAIVFGGELPRALGEMLIAVPPSPSEPRYGQDATYPQKLLSSIEADPAILGAALIPLMERYFAWSLPRNGA